MNDTKSNNSYYKIIFFRVDLSCDFFDSLKKQLDFNTRVCRVNKTGTLLNQKDKVIIVTDSKYYRKDINSLCNNSPVILIGKNRRRAFYKKIINSGYYDLINTESSSFNIQLINAINKVIKEYNVLKKQNLISKGLYFANVIHELRSPLNSIIGYSSILFENEAEAAKRNNIKTILESGKYMLSIVNDTLDFTKLQSGKLTINPIKFILKNTLDHISGIFDIRASQKNIDFILNYSENCPLIIEGDEFRFTQIIINILSNAFKFTPENGTIKLHCDYTDKSLIIKISDSGEGIPPESLEKIFLPFEQSSEKIERKFGGTGLGLAITKELINIMNGEITVSSIENEGTTFKIELPFKEVKEKPAETSFNEDYDMTNKWIKKMGSNEKLKKLILNAIRNLPERFSILEKAIFSKNIEEIKFNVHKLKGFTGSYGFTELYEILRNFDSEMKKDKPSPERMHSCFDELASVIQKIPASYFTDEEYTEKENDTEKKNSLKLLFVDDLEENRNLLKYYMDSLNISCTIAEGKKDSLEFIKNNNYDIIMLDIQMPDISGFDLLNIMKKISPESYYIAATGDTDKYTVNRIKYSGFNSYLFKPFTESILKKELGLFYETVAKKNIL